MKKIFALLTLLLLIFLIYGCSENSNTQLATPEDLVIENHMLTWDEVEGASGYLVSFNEEEFDTGIARFDLSPFEIISADIEIRIKAIGNDVLTDSDWSEVMEYTLSGEQNLTSILTSDSQAKILYSKGIGKTVDAINGTYLNVKDEAGDIFKEGALNQDTIDIDLRSSSNTSYTYADSVIDLLEQSNKKYFGKLNVGVDYKLFTSSFEKLRDTTSTFIYTTSTEELSVSIEEVISSYSAHICDYGTPSVLYDMLSVDFLKAVAGITNLEAADKFIGTYGTHLIAQGTMGGKFNYDYYYATNNSSFKSEQKNDVKHNLRASYSKFASTSGEDSFETDSFSASDQRADIETITVSTVGGMGVQWSSNNINSDKYDEWIDSLNNTDKNNTDTLISNNYNVLIQSSDNGLIPLWHLFASEYPEAAELLATAFEQQAIMKYDEFEKLIGRTPAPGDHTFFAGGRGTEDEPYLISEYKHLDNVRYKLDCYFKLIRDLDINSKWLPIGSESINLDTETSIPKPFTGHFDGSGFIISYDIDIVYRYNPYLRDYFYGLFGSTDGATIKNLYVEVNIHSKDFSGSNGLIGLGSNHRNIFVGQIAGIANNTTFINCHTSGTINLSVAGAKQNGQLIIGGIVGQSYGGEIKDCVNGSSIYGGHNVYSTVGGIVGKYIRTAITGCQLTGSIKAHNHDSPDHCYQDDIGLYLAHDNRINYLS